MDNPQETRRGFTLPVDLKISTAKVRRGKKHGGGRVVGFSLDEALRMLAAFESVGATHFDITTTDIDGTKQGFRSGQGSEAVAKSMPRLLQNASRSLQNVIVRPSGSGVSFVQLDDLDIAGIERVGEGSFLVLATSPGNYQAWIALQDGNPDLARRIRKASEADTSASGATRVAGSLNFKRKYEPDFPTIAIVAEAPGRIVTKDQLARLGLVAQADEPRKVTPPTLRFSSSRHRKAWPSYERCLQFAPPNHAGTAPDISRVDFAWAVTAIDWGWSIEDTATKLMEVSSKARADGGERYAILTAQNAAAVVAGRTSRR